MLIKISTLNDKIKVIKNQMIKKDNKKQQIVDKKSDDKKLN